MTKDSIRYIMFDFDGTIVDSMPFLENNAIYLLTNHYGFSPTEARIKYRKTTGLPFVQQMEIIAPTEDNTVIVDEFEKLKLERIFEQKLFAESYKVLTELKRLGYFLGISSGTIESIIIEYLRKKGMDIVDDILGWRQGFEKGKHHFDFVKLKYNLLSSEILFVGDSLNDAIRARGNNIQFIGRVGMFKLEDFQKIIPNTLVINTLTEIIHILPTL
ncbi:MAG: HAD family hydrolase [Promethearchaeota archaeon]